jgi:hypothetical protein
MPEDYRDKIAALQKPRSGAFIYFDPAAPASVIPDRAADWAEKGRSPLGLSPPPDARGAGPAGRNALKCFLL